jgi:hypothetical protein
MKKFLITLLFLSSLFSYPYKPKPILFVHGFMGNSSDWGVKIADYCTIPRCDTIEKDSIIQGETFDVFLQKMIPYVYAWWPYDTSYTRPEDTTLFPNKSFLEIINFNDPSGSLDPDTANYPKPFKGQGDELVERIRSILNEYYGNNWENNPDAKVILIAHSQIFTLK